MLMIIVLLSSLRAHAQWQTTHWLHVDGSLSERESKQSEALTQTTRRAAGRGEVGLNLLRHLSVSAGGAYQDGGASNEGSTVIKTAAPAFGGGYIGETRALAHLLYPPFVLSTGLAQMDQFDKLPGAYRSRTKYAYKPMQLTVNFGAAYVRLEQDLWTNGSVEMRLMDAGGGRGNVKFKLAKGAGQGAEVGVFLPTGRLRTHVFLNYHRWTVEPSSIENDGVESVRVPRTEVTRLEAGVGLAF